MHAPLPPHGGVSCTRCFPDARQKEMRVSGKFTWQLLHGPSAWGSPQPLVLLLGFSKGETQLNAVGNCAFEDIPFKKMRPNIERVLRRLALLPQHISLAQLITKSEQNFAFGSLLRCSIGKWQPEANEFIRSGSKMLTDCVGDHASRNLVSNCATQFLATLPERLRLVLLMGNERDYVLECYGILKQVRSGLRLLPSVTWKRKKHPVAYTDGVVIWCHFPHAAGQAISHLLDWANSANGLQAAKRDLALQAVEMSGVRLLLRWQTQSAP